MLAFDFNYWWWAVRADGALVRYDYTNEGAILEEIPGDYRKVAAWNETVCGLSAEGRIDCYGEGCTYGMCDAPMELGWVDVTMGWLHGCALHADGRVACWGPGELDAEALEDATICGQNTPPDERFVTIDASYLFTCGVRTDGYAMCWGNPASSTPPP